MKTLILFFCLSAFAFGATPTVVQKKAAGTGSSATSIATTSMTTTTGNSVACGCASANTSTTLSCADGTNTFTAVGSANSTQASEGSGRWFVAKNITGVAHVLTCSSTASGPGMSIYVYELNGASATAPVDVPTSGGTSGASGTSATPSFTLPATTFNNDLLLFFAQCGNTCAAAGGADVGNSQTDGLGDESETFAKTAIGTYSGTFTQTSATFLELGVAITDGGGGGGAVARHRAWVIQSQ